MKKIPPFRLIPQPLDDSAANLPGFKWAPAEVGKRHQLGGEPTFLQGAQHPKCPECGLEMTFYAQLDSISDEICIADCGMIYVFLCFDCYAVSGVVHSY